jgi:hypothetical protein
MGFHSTGYLFSRITHTGTDITYETSTNVGMVRQCVLCRYLCQPVPADIMQDAGG